MSKILVLCLCFSFIPFGLAGIWDGFPVISQVKSLVQVIGGDTDGARRTQENFVRQMPIVSQVTSAVQAASGDSDEAKKTQQQFLRKNFTDIQKWIPDNPVNKIIWHLYTGNTIEASVDGLPLLGHIKGGIHMAVGDEERGLEIIKGATSNTIAQIGGIAGGPGGAIAGKVIGDGIITAIDSKPYGFMQIGPDASVGDNFDNVMDTIPIPIPEWWMLPSLNYINSKKKN